MLGSLTDRSMQHVWLAAPFMIAGWVCLFATARALDAMTLGADVAQTLGTDIRRAQALIIGGSQPLPLGRQPPSRAPSGLSALWFHICCVHVGRRATVALCFRQVPLAAPRWYLAADIAVRIIGPTRDIKLGVLTALVGAPFFLWLVLKTRREAL